MRTRTRHDRAGIRTIPKSLLPPVSARRRRFARTRVFATLTPPSLARHTRVSCLCNARRRRGQDFETEEKRRDRPDHARREAKQEGRAEFRRLTRRGDAGPRAAGGADVRYGSGSSPPRDRPPEVLLRVRVPVVLQLCAVWHAVLQQEVQRGAH